MTSAIATSPVDDLLLRYDMLVYMAAPSLELRMHRDEWWVAFKEKRAEVLQSLAAAHKRGLLGLDEDLVRRRIHDKDRLAARLTDKLIRTRHAG